MVEQIIESASEAETEAAGRRLGAALTAGSTVLLAGELGAGKTAFVRGLAAGLGGDPDDVNSPTFTLVQQYDGRLTLQHADLYRLSPAEVPDLALDDLFDGRTVLAVEWADRWAAAPPDAVVVRLEATGPTTRRIRIVQGR